MVVPVLMTSCHVLEYLNKGPVAAHTNTISTAAENAHLEPTQLEATLQNRPKDPLRFAGAARCPASLGALWA
jgi:hypothetical protein